MTTSLSAAITSNDLGNNATSFTSPITNNNSICLRVKKLSPTASLPTRGSPLSAGFDLASAEKKTVPAKGKAIVKTDLSIACPPGTYARIAPRSGLAVKKFIDTGAGVVDADYRGNVGVVLFNFSDEDFEVAVGDRIAQLILEQICMVDAVEVEDLEETLRGAGGFGSTGVGKRTMGARSPVTVVETGAGVEASKPSAAEMLNFISKFDGLFVGYEQVSARWSKLRPAVKKLALDEDSKLASFYSSVQFPETVTERCIEDWLETLEIIGS
eukprot:CAMPEP_0172496128 /NCGR_PEP_ID=MMETSP1066-20121228/81867_1 /TAXON_ID=671091 /ORGANISM="Coscinodiscus wailesii, Strain CCMP2513" /LENGTH=269 /DNA_ID=CAMNT_0013268251 /DNA_START=215 /DNA_END=1024 /DNA_ORIENTATION=-